MSPEHISTPVPLKNRRKMSHGWLRFLKLIHKGRSQHAEWMLCSPCLYSHLHGTFLCQGNHRTFQGLKGGLATGDTEPMWVKITFREDVDTNHSVPMAQRSENYYALFFQVSNGRSRNCCWIEHFWKEIQNGSLKKPSVPQKGKYEGMGHSLVLLWHVEKWWEKFSCCKKKAKDQAFHRWRESKTLTERWLRSPETLMLATAQEAIWFFEGQST